MSTAALEVEKLGKRFGGLAAVNDVTLSVAQGDRHLILGPNGAGKTTLLNLIAGDLKPSEGNIRVFGHDLGRLPSEKRVTYGIARTFQVLQLFNSFSFLQNVMLALNAKDPLRWSPWRTFDGDAGLRDRAIDALRSVGLAELAHVQVDRAAYGNRRRLELAMALSQEPRLLLLDEPLAGLSRVERALVQKTLSEIRRDVTVIMIEHDMDIALEFAKQITVLHHGGLVLTGSRSQVVDDERTRSIYLGE